MHEYFNGEEIQRWEALSRILPGPEKLGHLLV
jgi:hypothetical protein